MGFTSGDGWMLDRKICREYPGKDEMEWDVMEWGLLALMILIRNTRVLDSDWGTWDWDWNLGYGYQAAGVCLFVYLVNPQGVRSIVWFETTERQTDRHIF
jgi:hypothetical protein